MSDSVIAATVKQFLIIRARQNQHRYVVAIKTVVDLLQFDETLASNLLRAHFIRRMQRAPERNFATQS
jgi:hypothetical protein